MWRATNSCLRTDSCHASDNPPDRTGSEVRISLSFYRSEDVGVERAPHLSPPSTQGLDRRGVVIDSNTDPAGIGSQVVDPVGDGQFRIGKVMHLDGFRRSPGAPLLATIVANFFFVSTDTTG